MYETINDAKFLQPWEFDRRDYLAGNVLKGLENLKPPKAFKWDILSTYDQWKLGSCTAMATTHSMKVQNEFEHKEWVELSWKDLWQKMGHSLTHYDGWDQIEKAVKTALKEGISWTLNWADFEWKAEAYAYWTWVDWRKHLLISPLICVIRANNTTRIEMLQWEIKTVLKQADINWWHAILLAGYDEEYMYFYNSWWDSTIKEDWLSSFKVKISVFEEMRKHMFTWRYFLLIDKIDLIDYAKEIELSKQIISGIRQLRPLNTLEALELFLLKKYNFEYQEPKSDEVELAKEIIRNSKALYEVADDEVKQYFQEIQVTKFFENKYKFVFGSDKDSYETIARQVIKAAKKLYEIGDDEMKKAFQNIEVTKTLEREYGFKY